MKKLSILINACLLCILVIFTLVGCNDSGSEGFFKEYSNEVSRDEYYALRDVKISETFLNPEYEEDYEFVSTGHAFEKHTTPVKNGEPIIDLRDTDVSRVTKYDKDNEIYYSISTDSDGDYETYYYTLNEELNYVRGGNIKTIISDETLESYMKYLNDDTMSPVWEITESSKYYVDGNVFTIVVDHYEDSFYANEKYMFRIMKETKQLIFNGDEIVIKTEQVDYYEYVKDYFDRLIGYTWDQQTSKTCVYKKCEQNLTVPQDVLDIEPR